MTQSEICKELGYSGLGNWNKPTDQPKEYEAYGDGRVSKVTVAADGTTTFLTGDTVPEILWQGKPEDEDILLELLEKFGHYAPC
jgi:hypothetical protein